jgi:hypothetical protein
MSSITLGGFESIALPEFGIAEIVAKVDTGAYSGALHCDMVRKVRTSEGEVLEFKLSDNAKVFTTTKFQRKHVRSASGHRSARYLIDTSIEIRGKKYPVTIGLSNRKDLNCAVLIGRRFLRENNFIVDVRLNQEYDKEKERQL